MKPSSPFSVACTSCQKLLGFFCKDFAKVFPRPTTKCDFMLIIQGLVSVPQSTLLTGKATVADASLEIEPQSPFKICWYLPSPMWLFCMYSRSSMYFQNIITTLSQEDTSTYLLNKLKR